MRANFATAPNGVIKVDGTSNGVSGPPDKKVFQFLRTRCDAILVGASTARAEHYSTPRTDAETNKAPKLVVATNSLNFPDEPKFLSTTDPPFIVTSNQTVERSPDKVRQLSTKASIISFGLETVDFGALFVFLYDLGIRVILCEGGPSIFAELLTLGLVDELCLTIAPRIAPGKPTGLVTLLTDNSIDMELAANFSIDNFLFCRYLISQ